MKADTNPEPTSGASQAGQSPAFPLAAGSVRSAFEAWITDPPMEKDVARNSTDDRKSAWPGQYRSYEVQLAWEAWCAALEATDCIAEYTGKENRRDWWSGGAWLYPGDRVAIVSSPNTQGLVTPHQTPPKSGT